MDLETEILIFFSSVIALLFNLKIVETKHQSMNIYGGRSLGGHRGL